MTEAAAFGALANDVGGVLIVRTNVHGMCILQPTVRGATVTAAVQRSHLSRPTSSSAFPKPHYFTCWI